MKDLIKTLIKGLGSFLLNIRLYFIIVALIAAFLTGFYWKAYNNGKLACETAHKIATYNEKKEQNKRYEKIYNSLPIDRLGIINFLYNNTNDKHLPSSSVSP